MRCYEVRERVCRGRTEGIGGREERCGFGFDVAAVAAGGARAGLPGFEEQDGGWVGGVGEVVASRSGAPSVPGV